MTPELHLRYSAGNGNGIFGLGWKLSLPSVRRDTERRLPQYGSTDRLVLDGSDLVEAESRVDEPTGMRVTRYLLRYDETSPRIEYWEPANEVGRAGFWSVTSADNVTSIYGATPRARIRNPTNGGIYEWLLELTFDGTGDIVRYGYKGEGDQPQTPELRTNAGRYLKRIQYGNVDPVRFGGMGDVLAWAETPVPLSPFFYEAVLDYGEHEVFEGADSVVWRDTFTERNPWKPRPDPITRYRSGFLLSTDRRCSRFLMFHRIPGEAQPVLVSSADFSYSQMSHNGTSLLAAVVRRGYALSPREGRYESEDYEAETGRGIRSGDYEIASIPPLSFSYTSLDPAHPDDLITLRGEGIEPQVGLDHPDVSLVDFSGRGLPDIVETRADGFRHWRNMGHLGDDFLGGVNFLSRAEVPLSPRNIALSDPAVSFGEVSGDAQADLLVARGRRRMGYCRGVADPDGRSGWEDYREFSPGEALPAGLDLSDPNLRLLDLTGNGQADALVTRGNEFLFFESRGADGFAEAVARSNPSGVRFSDPRTHLADMTGDGLRDIVVLDAINEQVTFWPNLGFGHFGRRHTMDGIVDPPTDMRDAFFADLDGSGLSDLVVARERSIDIWPNVAGARWGARVTVDKLPSLHGRPQFVDLFGTGIAGALWSARGGLRTYRYLPLSRCKPGLLTSVSNGMGQRTEYEYRTTVELRLLSAGRGEKWRGQLPMPVHVVTKSATYDEVVGTVATSEYTYAHGHYDSVDRRFIGFGRVERLDAEEFLVKPAAASTPRRPRTLTKRWYHTGTTANGSVVSRQYADEYHPGDPMAVGVDSVIAANIGPAERVEAVRSLAGKLLRTEVYALAGGRDPGSLLQTEERSYLLVGRGTPRGSSWASFVEQQLRYTYEASPSDPRVAHEMVLARDAFGHATRSVEMSYARRPGAGSLAEQRRAYGTFTATDYCSAIDRDLEYRHGVTRSVRTAEVLGVRSSTPLARTEIHLEDDRLVGLDLSTHPISARRYFYWADDARTALAPGVCGALALVRDIHQLVLTDELLEDIFDDRVSPNDLAAQGYVRAEGRWWRPNGHRTLGNRLYDQDQFYQLVATVDPFGATLDIEYDPLRLRVVKVTDPVGNSTAGGLDYRYPAITRLTDPNGNRRAILMDPLGRVVALAVADQGATDPDNLEGLTATLPKTELARVRERPRMSAVGLLVNATERTVYDLWNARPRDDGPEPAVALRPGPVVHTFQRHVRGARIDSEQPVGIRQTVRHHDSFGRPVCSMVFVGVEDAPRSAVVEGRTEGGSRAVWACASQRILDRLGSTVFEYHPHFREAAALADWVGIARWGIARAYHYDALGRLVATFFPDGSVRRKTIGAWNEAHFDGNDTVGDPESSWYERQTLSGDEHMVRTARGVLSHAGTPTVQHLDPRGRRVRTEEIVGESQSNWTRRTLDIKDDIRVIEDARDNVAFRRETDLSGAQLRTDQPDRGTRRYLRNAIGKLAASWDDRGTKLRHVYDAAGRLTHVFRTLNDSPEVLILHRVYGEGVPGAVARNQLGELVREYDEAGVTEYLGYDADGHLVRSRRMLPRDLTPLRWGDSRTEVGAEILGGGESLVSEWRYNALGRLIEHVAPEGLRCTRGYDERGLLKEATVHSRTGGDVLVLRKATYTADERRAEVEMGNNVESIFNYHRNSLRIARIETTRRTDGQRLQDLRYYSDAEGNVWGITDAAQDAVFFDNQRAEATWTFEYDPLYRLINATGREHPSLAARPRSSAPLPATYGAHPNDAQTLIPYSERYTYDPAGNLTSVAHRTRRGGWTRQNQYSPSNNRLLRFVALAEPSTASYSYDGHGCMVQTPRIEQITWNHRDQLTGARIGNGTRVSVSCTYNGAGLRERKLSRRGQHAIERIYFGAFERLRERTGSRDTAGRDSYSVYLEDGTLLAMVSIGGASDDDAGPVLDARFLHTSHLQSVHAESDRTGRLIRYEEYHPFGTTAYRAALRSPAPGSKRVAWAGKEKDDLTGLYFFGARYYAPWLGRWMSPDPAGLIDGLNLYAFARNNPVSRGDPDGRASRKPDDEDEAPATHAYEHTTTEKSSTGSATTIITRKAEAAEGDSISSDEVPAGGSDKAAGGAGEVEEGSNRDPGGPSQASGRAGGDSGHRGLEVPERTGTVGSEGDTNRVNTPHTANGFRLGGKENPETKSPEVEERSGIRDWLEHPFRSRGGTRRNYESKRWRWSGWLQRGLEEALGAFGIDIRSRDNLETGVIGRPRG